MQTTSKQGLETRWCWMLLGSSRPSKSPLESLKNSDQRVFLLKEVQPTQIRRKTQFIEILELGTVVQAKSRKLTRGVRHGRAKRGTVMPKAARSCTSHHGRHYLHLARHCLALDRHWLACTVVLDCARSCIGQHYHAWPSTTWLHGRVWKGTASARFGMTVHIWGFAQELLKFHIRLDFLPSKAVYPANSQKQ
ncbi:hypothetical protein E3N88_24703 [Mikania micrantha]|uniref:Uncharacterized protein n=1 Tax=Mikania micrantha TaxID=192012 RepID=A0A5N6N2M3_9ASTR|nr:hypothetical protein E3N88_24703 [Mikania micrantha]